MDLHGQHLIGTRTSRTGTNTFTAIDPVRAAPLEPVFAEARPGDVRDSRADIAKAADLIGYRPIASLRDGLVQTCAWYRSTVGANG